MFIFKLKFNYLKLFLAGFVFCLVFIFCSSVSASVFYNFSDASAGNQISNYNSYFSSSSATTLFSNDYSHTVSPSVKVDNGASTYAVYYDSNLFDYLSVWFYVPDTGIAETINVYIYEGYYTGEKIYISGVDHDSDGERDDLRLQIDTGSYYYYDNAYVEGDWFKLTFDFNGDSSVEFFVNSSSMSSSTLYSFVGEFSPLMCNLRGRSASDIIYWDDLTVSSGPLFSSPVPLINFVDPYPGDVVASSTNWNLQYYIPDDSEYNAYAYYMVSVYTLDSQGNEGLDWFAFANDSADFDSLTDIIAYSYTEFSAGVLYANAILQGFDSNPTNSVPAVQDILDRTITGYFTVGSSTVDIYDPALSQSEPDFSTVDQQSCFFGTQCDLFVYYNFYDVGSVLYLFNYDDYTTVGNEVASTTLSFSSTWVDTLIVPEPGTASTSNYQYWVMLDVAGYGQILKKVTIHWYTENDWDTFIDSYAGANSEGDFFQSQLDLTFKAIDNLFPINIPIRFYEQWHKATQQYEISKSNYTQIYATSTGATTSLPQSFDFATDIFDTSGNILFSIASSSSLFAGNAISFYVFGPEAFLTSTGFPSEYIPKVRNFISVIMVLLFFWGLYRSGGEAIEILMYFN